MGPPSRQARAVRFRRRLHPRCAVPANAADVIGRRDIAPAPSRTRSDVWFPLVAPYATYYLTAVFEATTTGLFNAFDQPAT